MTELTKHKSLREMLDEFEQIVAWFDGDELDVEAATAKYEQGAKLAETIREKLATEKNKIEIVKRKFDKTSENDFEITESADSETDS